MKSSYFLHVRYIVQSNLVNHIKWFMWDWALSSNPLRTKRFGFFVVVLSHELSETWVVFNFGESVEKNWLSFILPANRFVRQKLRFYSFSHTMCVSSNISPSSKRKLRKILWKKNWLGKYYLATLVLCESFSERRKNCVFFLFGFVENWMNNWILCGTFVILSILMGQFRFNHSVCFGPDFIGLNDTITKWR